MQKSQYLVHAVKKKIHVNLSHSLIINDARTTNELQKNKEKQWIYENKSGLEKNGGELKVLVLMIMRK